MASLIERLRELRAEGATRVAFHPSGELAEVEFGAGAISEDQHDGPEQVPPPTRRVTGALVPRAQADRD